MKKIRTLILSLLTISLILVSTVTPAIASPQIADTTYESTVDRYTFRVEIEGVDCGAFDSVEGLGLEQAVIEYQNGDDPLTRKRPGSLSYYDLVLTRQFTPSSTLNDWIEVARCGNGNYERKTISIILTDSKNEELKRWNCYQCFPKSWKFYSSDSKGNDALMEELVIVIDYFEES